jgi:hypothetical protein
MIAGEYTLEPEDVEVDGGPWALELDAGDLLVLRCVVPIKADSMKFIAEQAEHALPGNKVIVLPPGVEVLGCLRPTYFVTDDDKSDSGAGV